MPRRSQHERTETTRAALIDAARGLFAEHGFSGVPAGRITAAAGVTRGAMVHHFGDKTGLFRVVFEAIEVEITSELRETFEALGDRDPVTHLVAAFLDSCARPEVVQVALTDAPAVLGWQAWREIESRHGLGLLTEISSLLPPVAAGILTAPVLAQLTLSCLIEAALLVAHAADPAAARREAEASLHALLQGVTHTTPPRRRI